MEALKSQLADITQVCDEVARANREQAETLQSQLNDMVKAYDEVCAMVNAEMRDMKDGMVSAVTSIAIVGGERATDRGSEEGGANTTTQQRGTTESAVVSAGRISGTEEEYTEGISDVPAQAIFPTSSSVATDDRG